MPASHSQLDRDTRSLQNAQTPLLRLPAELKNEIYAYVLTEPESEYAFGDIITNRMDPRALLSTCRQIHHEASALPFKLNFCAFKSLYWLETILPSLLPAQRQHIRSIRLEHEPLDLLEETFVFVEDMKARGFESLKDMLPSVNRVEVRFTRNELKSTWILHHGRYRWLYPEHIRAMREKEWKTLQAWLKGGDEKMDIIASTRVGQSWETM